MSTQNQIVTLLSFAQMGKFFSHFGVRSLLILYMVKQLAYSDLRAFTVNAVFCGITELVSIFGGALADRYLGLKKSVIFGAILLGAGYFCLYFEPLFLVATCVIMTGFSLFSSNISALLGKAFKEGDPNRKKGFTLFYMMRNFGAFLSIVLCSFVAEKFGYRAGFLVASFGMIGCSIMLITCKGILKGIGESSIEKRKVLPPILFLALIFVTGLFCIYNEKVVMTLLPYLTAGVLAFYSFLLLKNKTLLKKEVFTLLLYLSAIILFFGAEDQICSSVLLFVDRVVDKNLLGFSVPTSFITGVNPIVILVFGAFFAKRSNSMITPFTITAASFGILSLFCILKMSISIFGLMGVVAVIAIAELMIGPVVYAKASEIGAKSNSGVIMGMVGVAFSLAFQLSGEFSKLLAVEDLSTSLTVYGRGFGILGLAVFSGGILLHTLLNRKKVKIA